MPQGDKTQWDIKFKNLEIDQMSNNVRIDFKKKLIQEHLRGLNWHKECIDRLEKEISEIEQS